MRRLVAVAAVLAITGCALDKQTTPALVGPSEMGLSLVVTVTPDVITQDGRSEATVSVLALDALSRPVSGLALRLETAVGGLAVDFGSLVSRTLFTDSGGRASTKYIAPPPPPNSTGVEDVVVQVRVTPIGNNYANAVARTVDLLVSPPGERLGPNGTPVAEFTFSPTTPKEGEFIVFDARGSKDDGTIVSYDWTFGDGAAEAGDTTTHGFELAGKYIVTLTVTDDRGLKASKTMEVTVAANVAPTANFTTSPSAVRVGQTMQLNAQSSTAAPGRGISSWEWDFGDGTFGSGELTTKIYGTAGTFTITLRVRDSAGSVGTVSKTVTILP